VLTTRSPLVPARGILRGLAPIRRSGEEGEMMRLLGFLEGIAIAASLAACGGNVVVDHGGAGGAGVGGSTASNSSASGAGGVCSKSPGDCATDADCPGGSCAPLTPGGYRVCLDIPPPATSCSTPMDQCCSAADCPNGAPCYSTDVITLCKGGPAMPIFNECVADACATDADCLGGMAPQICAPAGAFGNPLRSCFRANCHTDADCTAAPCGACVTVSSTCCAVPAGLACVYPGGCRKDADCGAGNSCQIDSSSGASHCVSGLPPCPV
jgi:hypothetical protein